MEIERIVLLVVAAGALILFIRNIIKIKKLKAHLPSIMEKGAIVIDVRTPEEYRKGARPESLNIPLASMESRWQGLDKNQTYILCCASGARSAAAERILRAHGFTNVYNAGAWQNTLT